MEKDIEFIKNENEYKFFDKFHQINELSSYYKSKIDYKKLFNNLENNTKNNLNEITNKIYNLKIKDNLKFKENTTNNIYFFLDGVDTVDSVPCTIKIYITRYYFEEENVDDYEPETRIGCSIYGKDEFSERLLQHIYYNNINFLKIKEYLYTILFFAHIIVKTFKSSPLLYNLYHKDDIEEMNNIKKINIQLFGNNENDCCVCYDNTIHQLYCSHYLCINCYLKLSIKQCPLCRVDLIDEYSGSVTYLY